MTGSVRNQYLTAICVNIFTLSYGTICGWSSAALLVLQSDESPLESGPLTKDEASWIGAIMCIGGLLGNVAFGWISNKYGRRMALIIASFPLIFSFLMIPYSKNSIHLCISRFIGGFTGSAAFAVIPIYITEIAEDSVRGSLGSTIMIFCNFGILTSFVFGNFFSYILIPYLLAIFPTFFLVLIVLCLPESPSQLLRMGREEDALKALIFFSGENEKEKSEVIMKELERMKDEVNSVDEKKSDRGVSWSDFTPSTTIKAMTIGIVLMCLNQFCGIFAMLNYTASIFEQAGSSLSPNMSAIIVAFIQVIGSYTATLLVERAGRKILYLVSTVGSAIGLSVLGIYINLSSKGYDCSDFEWVPVLSFSLTIFFAQLAILSLPFLIIAEILPSKIRSLGSNICLTLLWFLSFSVLKGLPFLVEMLGLHGMMMLFASFCFLGAVYILVFLPETKGRSIDEIIGLFK
ncbi:hypothetical protein ACFFRR_001648 [Megaselia abdita]